MFRVSKRYIIMLLIFIITMTMAIMYFTQNFISDGEAYLHKFGFKKIEHLENERHSYILEVDMLTQLPYKYIWGVQEVSPDSYIGKEINVERYRVEDHPLGKHLKEVTGDSYIVYADVFIVDNRVIGGVSIPTLESGVQLFGSNVYPIDSDGKEDTIENYQKWSEQWDEKYGVN